MGYLPDSGGINDQCAWLLDAFNAMSVFEDEMMKVGE